MNYCNVIGFQIFIVFLLQFFSGLLLSSYYSSFIAYNSVNYIMIDVNIGWIIRYFHVLGASLFLAMIKIHLIRGIWIRMLMIEQIEIGSLINMNYIELNIIWLSGWFIFIILLIDCFLGYICSWGQMSYWGITVMINILTVVPFIGIYIGEYIWCSSLVIVNRIFVLHFIFGFIIVCIILVHINLLHSFSSSNPFINNNSIIIPFYSLFFKDVNFSYVILTILLLYLFLEPDILGNCDNLVLANPIQTPNHILPEWYFLLFYSSLRALPNKTMGVIIVFLLIVIL